MRISDMGTPIHYFDVDYFSLSQLKFISGGQTGADQAGLEAAKECNVLTGGWAPKSWQTQDGPRPTYLNSMGLIECETFGYAARTELNVRDADLTLRFASNFASAGERCTYNAIKKFRKPFVDFDLDTCLTLEFAQRLADYIFYNGFHTINIAGNAERTSPGIHTKVKEFLIITIGLLKTLSEQS